ncbi:Epidermal growth factor-binding protein type B [Branchiostoma belcheri]|nr:Epidermal growth factor-binding protein type B [Branchiostoma belcheri]
MAGSGRCAGLITIISGLLLLPTLARRGGPPGRPGGRTTPASGLCRQGAFLYGNRCYDVSEKDVQEDYDTAVERCSALGPGGRLAVLKDAKTMDGLANIFSPCSRNRPFYCSFRDVTSETRDCNKDGGRYRLSDTYDPLLQPRVSDVTSWKLQDVRKPTTTLTYTSSTALPHRAAKCVPAMPLFRGMTAIGRGAGPVNFWIGLRRKPSGTADRSFHFADGTPLGSFSRWTGEDPGAGDERDCVAVMLRSGNDKPKWKRFKCDKNSRYICQSETNVHQNSEESTAANSLTTLTTEITTQGPQDIAASTTGHMYTYSTDGPPREPAKHEAGTPTAPPEPLTAKHRAGRGKEEKKSSVNLWLLLPGLQITGMLILMVWGTVYAWKLTEGGTRPLSATSSTVSAASDVPISERIPKNFEDPE